MGPGLQAAQAVHAAVEISLRHPEIVRRWHAESNNVVVVAAPDPSTYLGSDGCTSVVFREPDLGNIVSAVALLGPGARTACANLPLAGSRA